MSKQSKNVTAANRAVERSQVKSKTERTPEQVIADIRRNLGANLAVTPDDQRFLLAVYDGAVILLNDSHAEVVQSGDAIVKLREQIETLMTANAELTAKNEEFRAVYEQENRSTTLQVDVLEPPTFEISGTMTAQTEPTSA